MKNIVLDLMMGIVCILCVVTIIGLMLLPVVPDYWKGMRTA